MRILVIGSKEWTDEEIIENLIAQTIGLDPNVTVVCGGRPTGVDRTIKELAIIYGWQIECHDSIEWMIKLGADVCFAFIKYDSPEETNNADLVEQSGIPVIRVER